MNLIALKDKKTHSLLLNEKKVQNLPQNQIGSGIVVTGRIK
jgi:hypothetical protein